MDILDALAGIGEETLLSDLAWHRECVRATLHLIRALRAWKAASQCYAEEPPAVPEARPRHRYWYVFNRVRKLLPDATRDDVTRLYRHAGYHLVRDMTDDQVVNSILELRPTEAEQDADSDADQGASV